MWLEPVIYVVGTLDFYSTKDTNTHHIIEPITLLLFEC